MAISKITLNGVTQMDVTSKTVTSGTMLDGTTALKSDGTDITGNIATKTSVNMIANGATVTALAGYYASDASKSVASGSATAPASITGTSATVSTGTNTLTLSKTISVTPTVSAGYVSSGTAGNSSVSLTANINMRSSSDLSVSGDTVTAPSGYYSSSASASVASGTAGTPTAAKGTVSNHAVIVTPSVTNTTGYITGGTKTGTAVSVSASELVSGSQTVTHNGTFNVTNLAQFVTNIPLGAEYETGVFNPTTDVSSQAISFSKTHIGLPFYFLFTDATGTYDSTYNSNIFVSYYNWQTLLGTPQYYSSTGVYYGEVRTRYRGTNASTLASSQINITYPDTDTGSASTEYPAYWVSETGFTATTATATTRYWRPGRKYKWIALWEPTVDTQWELNGINASTGADTTDSTRIRSIDYIPADPSVRIYMRNNANVSIRAYRSDYSFIAFNGTWRTSDFVLSEAIEAAGQTQDIAYVKLVGRYSDNRSISDVQTLADNIVVRGITS